MDATSMGSEICTSVVGPLSRKLLEKTIDPEKVAESITWLFTATDHFIKVRKKEAQKDMFIAPPPPAVPQDKPAGEVSPAQVAEKAAAVAAIAQAPSAAQPGAVDGIQLENLSDFEMEFLNAEIDTVLAQIESQLGKLHLDEQRAAQAGGPEAAPAEIKNAIRVQQNSLVTLLLRLNRTMKKAYGVATPNLYLLMSATEAKA